MKHSVVAITANEPTPFLLKIVSLLDSVDIEARFVKISDLNLAAVSGNDTIALLDFDMDESGMSELLLRMQKTDLVRNLSVFAIVKESTDSKSQEILQSGAADILKESDPLQATTLRLDQALGTSLTRLKSDIDISPHETKVSTKNLKVLVVEDDSLLKNLLQTKFEQSNVACLFSLDGKDLIETAIKDKPDVVLLDIMLPGANGLDLLEDLKNNPATSHTPVIIFSNRDEQADRKRAQKLGAVGYFVKATTELSELLQEIEKSVQ